MFLRVLILFAFLGLNPSLVQASLNPQQAHALRTEFLQVFSNTYPNPVFLPASSQIDAYRRILGFTIGNLHKKGVSLSFSQAHAHLLQLHGSLVPAPEWKEFRQLTLRLEAPLKHRYIDDAIVYAMDALTMDDILVHYFGPWVASEISDSQDADLLVDSLEHHSRLLRHGIETQVFTCEIVAQILRHLKHRIPTHRFEELVSTFAYEIFSAYFGMSTIPSEGSRAAIVRGFENIYLRPFFTGALQSVHHEGMFEPNHSLAYRYLVNDLKTKLGSDYNPMQYNDSHKYSVRFHRSGSTAFMNTLARHFEIADQSRAFFSHDPSPEFAEMKKLQRRLAETLPFPELNNLPPNSVVVGDVNQELSVFPSLRENGPISWFIPIEHQKIFLWAHIIGDVHPDKVTIREVAYVHSDGFMQRLEFAVSLRNPSATQSSFAHGADVVFYRGNIIGRVGFGYQIFDGKVRRDFLSIQNAFDYILQSPAAAPSLSYDLEFLKESFLETRASYQSDPYNQRVFELLTQNIRERIAAILAFSHREAHSDLRDRSLEALSGLQSHDQDAIFENPAIPGLIQELREILPVAEALSFLPEKTVLLVTNAQDLLELLSMGIVQNFVSRSLRTRPETQKGQFQLIQSLSTWLPDNHSVRWLPVALRDGQHHKIQRSPVFQSMLRLPITR